MITGKRTAILVGALAALALPGCAPAGYNPDEENQVSVANEAAAEAEASTAPAPDASDAPEGTEGTEQDKPTKEVAAEDLTTKLTAKKINKMGTVVVDQDGFTLYRFEKDTTDPAASNCVQKCEQVWPPAYTEDGEPELVGVSDEKVGVITRQDGTKQLTLGDWPLYRYIGDTKPAAWKGQGVGGTWFVIQPDGKRNLSCLPTNTPKAVEPPAENKKDGATTESSGGSTYSY